MPTMFTDAELLARLVSFDSTSSRSILPIADFVCEVLDRPGIRIERFPCPEPDKVNLVVTVGPEPDEKRTGLVLSGHLDVVPATEPEWLSDPFTVVTTDDAFIGRGTADMKGFDAVMINAALRAARSELTHPLVLLITCDEEIGTVGACHLAKDWPGDRPLPRRAVIGEPTSLEVVRMHKGHCRLRVRATGRSAHSGYPHLGKSAIEPMGPILCALADLRRQLQTETSAWSHAFPEVPFVALNVGTLRGGSAVNIVPDHCEMELGFRVLPGMQNTDLLGRVEETISKAARAEDVTWEVLNESPPMLLAEDSDLHRTLCAWRGQSEGLSASYATDAGWIQEMGCDCCVCGPGTIEVAHRPNESIPRAELEEGARLVERMIETWCR